MTDEAMIPPVAEVMARRIADRIGGVVGEDARFLERRLADLDSWTLETLLKLTSPERRRGGEHLGVVGVDHCLNRLVTERSSSRLPADPRLEAVDLEELDDDDLISASHYVPETLPGYMLG